jgi:hypothetical protein
MSNSVKRRLQIERPDVTGMTREQMQYMNLLEIAGDEVSEAKPHPMDPRAWPASTHLAIVLAILTAFGWAFNSGGEWKQVESRLQAMETRQSQYESIYARRDLLEQQMGYVVTGLNELKVKVDQLAARQTR